MGRSQRRFFLIFPVVNRVGRRSLDIISSIWGRREVRNCSRRGRRWRLRNRSQIESRSRSTCILSCLKVTFPIFIFVTFWIIEEQKIAHEKIHKKIYNLMQNSKDLPYNKSLFKDQFWAGVMSKFNKKKQHKQYYKAKSIVSSQNITPLDIVKSGILISSVKSKKRKKHMRHQKKLSKQQLERQLKLQGYFFPEIQPPLNSSQDQQSQHGNVSKEGIKPHPRQFRKSKQEIFNSQDVAKLNR